MSDKQHVDPDRVDRRISHNLDLGMEYIRSLEPDTDKWIALSKLFSVLSHLEHIAVIAGRRGNGVPGQLEDEIVHEETFAQLADSMAGFEPMSEPVRELVEFVSELNGDNFLTVLNVISEAWLETVFRHVASWGIAPALFELIGKEEKRHVYEASREAKPDPDEVAPLVRVLEQKLFATSHDPHFIWPLCFLSETNDVALMGRQATKAHRAALEQLGLEPSQYVSEIGRCGRDIRLDREPRRAEMTECQRSHFVTDAQPIWSVTEIRYPHDESELEARVVAAIGSALAEKPYLNTVVHPARQEIYRPHNPIVGVRRLYDGVNLVSTIYVRNPHRHAFVGQLKTNMRSLAKRTRALPYAGWSSYSPALERLSPPTRVAAVVTNCQYQFPCGTYGMLSLNKAEGATIGVVISPVYRKGLLRRKYIKIGVTVDHRVHMGREMGELVTHLKQSIEGDPF